MRGRRRAAGAVCTRAAGPSRSSRGGGDRRSAITFAVIGHNEGRTLGVALCQALAAASAADRVLFVDSASSDDSAAVAASLGVDRLDAPIGKGRAMQRAIESCTTEYICFVDGDIYGSACNIAARLGAVARATDAAMVVGQFVAHGGPSSNTMAVYAPLVAALFPEARARYGTRPLSGFRVLRVSDVVLPLPAGFGVEAHLNVTMAIANASWAMADIGEYQGHFVYKPDMGREIAATLLGLAERLGRIDGVERLAWQTWLDPVFDCIAGYRGDLSLRDAYAAELQELAARLTPAVLS